MSSILILGATGNVGREVIKHLLNSGCSAVVFAGVRNPQRAIEGFPVHKQLKFRRFDFEDQSSFGEALKGIDVLFLLRPPQIADVDRYIKPLLNYAKNEGVKKIVFLSVQGVEQSKFIPHHKIEKLILAMSFKFVFLRPSYFMQNLTTTLLPEIQEKGSITLPAGGAKFNWVDVEDIGAFAAKVLCNFDVFSSQTFELTGLQNLSFQEVSSLIQKKVGIKINYRSVSPLRFFC
ncbi:NmrA family NAD(P)-binding protein [Algoriphagus halophilus]|uniref:NmrA family NAD(P)-binding protein n=1 Tax=Algoriphagus halophilus TaxID=226505 RepID=UPI00358FB7F8